MNSESASTIEEWVKEDRVHRRVYLDPDLFTKEMELIFERLWVFVGHESEIAKPGDYKTAYVGPQPVILSRHQDGKVYVVMNRCMHRGAVVCREASGNTEFFRCIYHGWTYNTRGDLTAVPYRAGYGAGFDQSALGLKRAQVASYRGFVFARLRPGGESLDEHLGRARYYLDLILDAAPQGEIEVNCGVQKYSYPANWKFQIENCVDGYHPNFTHESAFTIRNRRGGRSGSVEGMGGVARGLGRGHCVLDYKGRAGYWSSVVKKNPAYLARLSERLGRERAEEVLSCDIQLLVFPNLFFQNHRQHFRSVRPLGVDRTEVYAYPYRLKGAADEINDPMVQNLGLWASAAGFGQPDDIEAFVRCQEGLQVGEPDWVLFSRGLGRERTDVGGEIVGDITDEVPQRTIYREWQRVLASAPDQEKPADA
jgi:phenylpropionate dioxygenase-like ring-hydroxylating dioxygenase large terminal subunit